MSNTKNPKEQNNPKNRKGRIILKNLTKEQRQNVLSGVGGALIGAAGNAGIIPLMSFVSYNETQLDNPENLTDQNSEELTEPVIVYTEAPFAESVTERDVF